MPDGKAPTIIAVLLLLLAALLFFQPYTADWPGTAYGGPVRRYLRTAMREDSVGLVRVSASDRPVRWALDVARTRPRALANWTGRIQAYGGPRHADTAEVFVFPAGRACEEAPIVLRVIGEGSAMRVLEAESACLR